MRGRKKDLKGAERKRPRRRKDFKKKVTKKKAASKKKTTKKKVTRRGHQKKTSAKTNILQSPLQQRGLLQKLFRAYGKNMTMPEDGHEMLVRALDREEKKTKGRYAPSIIKSNIKRPPKEDNQLGKISALNFLSITHKVLLSPL